MIASVILLVIALGVIPLFVRSVTLNQEGRLASIATSIASSELERLMDSPFNGPELTLGPSQSEILVEEYQAEQGGDWELATNYTEEDGYAFHRIVRIRQFGLGALSATSGTATTLDEAERLPEGTPENQVQVKEIVVQVESGPFAGGSAKQVTLRVLKTI